MAIDSGVITLVQTTFLQHLSATFQTVAVYALRLLYLFATLEVVVFGLVWALQRDVGWGKLLFKVLKIGLIFFIIQNFPWLLNTIISSFTALSNLVVANSKVAQFIFNPAVIWQYGYDAGIHLFQAATTTNNFAMVLIQIALGAGILLVFGLLGIQIVLQVVGFYLVAFTGLILLPFGTFTPSRRMFDKTIQSVLQAGVRLMVLICIIGIGITIWDSFDLTSMTEKSINISQPLGLFFTTLLFLLLAIHLPKIVAASVGAISSTIFNEGPSPVVEVAREGGAQTATASSMVDFQAATAIEAGSGSTTAPMSTAAAASGMGVTGGTATFGTMAAESSFGKSNLTDDTISQASMTSKSISDKTIKKIVNAIKNEK